MGRLKQQAGLLSSAPLRLLGPAPTPEADRHRLRDATQPGRAWYKTSDWQKLRWSVLVRDLFTCRKCGRIEADTSQLVGDHIIPHKGDPALFWDAANVQCLCKACHDRIKQAEERAAGW